MRRKKEIDRLAERRAAVTPPDDLAAALWRKYERTLGELVRENVETKGCGVVVEYAPGYGRPGEWLISAEYRTLDIGYAGLGNLTMALRDWRHLPQDATFEEILAVAQELCLLVGRCTHAAARALVASLEESI